MTSSEIGKIFVSACVPEKNKGQTLAQGNVLSDLNVLVN